MMRQSQLLDGPLPIKCQKIDNPVVLERFNWYAKQVNHAAKSKIGDKSVKQEWQDILDGKIAKGVKGCWSAFNNHLESRALL